MEKTEKKIEGKGSGLTREAIIIFIMTCSCSIDYRRRIRGSLVAFRFVFFNGLNICVAVELLILVPIGHYLESLAVFDGETIKQRRGFKLK